MPASRSGGGKESGKDAPKREPRARKPRALARKPKALARKPKALARACPICGKPATEASHPFCSERCRDVDLNRWLSGSYAIPGRAGDEDDGE